MATVTNSLGSFNTNQITLDNALMTIKIPFTAKSEKAKKIIKESYDTFKKEYPEATNLRHEIYIFFHLRKSMKPRYNFEVIIYDNKQGISKTFGLWQADYGLSNETKEEIKKIVWQQLSELMFGK